MQVGKFWTQKDHMMPIIGQDMGEIYNEKLSSHSYHVNMPCVMNPLFTSTREYKYADGNKPKAPITHQYPGGGGYSLIWTK